MSGVLDFITRALGSQQPTVQPAAQPSPSSQMISAAPQMSKPTKPVDPYAADVSAVQQRFPRLARIPLNVTQGKGPYESEVYQPWQSNNPAKGKFTVEMRSDKAKAQRGPMLQDSIAAESFHHLGTTKPDGSPVDPEWWNLKQQFRKTLTSRDLELAKEHWQEEQKSSSPEDRRSFDDFMNQNYLDMFVRGYIFPESQGQEWVDRKGKWPTQQAAVLEKMKGLLQQQ